MDIYPVSNGFSTAYLVVDGGSAMLVDASSESIAPKVLAKLAEARAELRLIVLTHYHFDHVGAAGPLREATGAPVAIHRLDADPLRRGGALRLHPNRPLGHVMAPIFSRGVKAPVTPDLEFGDEEDLGGHGGFGRSFWTPGHTAGSQSVRLPDGTVLAGDALSAGFPPSRAERPMFADDVAASRASIVAIADAAGRDVRIAHFGTVGAPSVARLAARNRPAG
ncbi:MAG: MBL fold metallo-hydrolase [Actinobacteria bacterium]|nr:MBL fold metallo-hydrolase [Actinomycetota bacterium]